MDNADDEFDLDANNYSRKELLSLCDIPGDGSDVSIIKATNARILQYGDNPPVKQFFEDIQDKLLGKQKESFENWHNIKDVEGVEEDQEGDEFDEEEQGEEESPFQEDDDIGKGLDAEDIYARQHEMGSDPPVPARSNWKLGITDKTTSSIPVQQQTYLGAREVKQVPFAQGTINPRVKNMTQRIINLDSQYRSMPGGVSYKYPTPGCSTNYSVTLSESLKNAMSITLNSYEIPYSWVGIDPLRGNNKLAIKIEGICGSLSSPQVVCWACLTFNAGNWSLDVIDSVLAYPKSNPSSTSAGSWSYTNNSGGEPCTCLLPDPSDASFELKVTPDGFIELSVTHDIITNGVTKVTVYFWGVEVEKNCSHNCTAVSNNYQNSLGWLLGFRTQSVVIYDQAAYLATGANGATASAFPVWARTDGIIGPSDPAGSSGNKLADWKMTQYIPYFYVVLEDHNKNHNNKGVLNIIPAASVLNLPSYAKQTGMKRDKDDGTILVGEDGGVCDSSGSKPGDEVQPSYYNGQVVGGIYQDPQHLTQAQLYTIAAIKNNRTFRSPYSVPTGPSDSDILAKITLPSLDYSKFGKFIPDNGGSLQLNTRAYFGPVDLDRFTIKLIDNNGNLVNLNNRDWSFTLRVEQLYQY
ncbi:MAG: hypothetical protein ACXABD_01190 [Candidatus Thorarchaeota archaeon]|jgi:hypothetical protein